MDANLSFDEVKEAIAAHERELSLLKSELPKACERAGHQWSKPKRDDICDDPGDYVEAVPCNGEDYGVPGYYRRAPQYSEAYSRTCQRCGAKDKRRAITIVRSPFESA